MGDEFGSVGDGELVAHSVGAGFDDGESLGAKEKKPETALDFFAALRAQEQGKTVGTVHATGKNIGTAVSGERLWAFWFALPVLQAIDQFHPLPTPAHASQAKASRRVCAHPQFDLLAWVAVPFLTTKRSFRPRGSGVAANAAPRTRAQISSAKTAGRCGA